MAQGNGAPNGGECGMSIADGSGWFEGVSGYFALRVGHRVVAHIERTPHGVFAWELLETPREHFGVAEHLGGAKRAAERAYGRATATKRGLRVLDGGRA